MIQSFANESIRKVHFSRKIIFDQSVRSVQIFKKRVMNQLFANDSFENDLQGNDSIGRERID